MPRVATIRVDLFLRACGCVLSTKPMRKPSRAEPWECRSRSLHCTRCISAHKEGAQEGAATNHRRYARPCPQNAHARSQHAPPVDPALCAHGVERCQRAHEELPVGVEIGRVYHQRHRAAVAGQGQRSERTPASRGRRWRARAGVAGSPPPAWGCCGAGGGDPILSACNRWPGRLRRTRRGRQRGSRRAGGAAGRCAGRTRRAAPRAHQLLNCGSCSSLLSSPSVAGRTRGSGYATSVPQTSANPW